MERVKYIKFTTEEFMLDKEFVCWILYPDKKRDLFWQSFLEDYPEKGEQISNAALIIRSLRPIENEITERKLNSIFRTINIHERSKILIGARWMRYAAGIALLITTGTLLWLSLRVNHSFPVEADNSTRLKGKVIFSNGLIREFETEKTIITQTSSGKLTINNDTVDLNNSTTELAQRKDVENEVAMNQIIIPYGKRSEITLADGTHIWLNSGSQLSYPSRFKTNSREVYLTGEAFFDVTADANKPFYVMTHDFKIKVLGTKFNVSSYSEDRTIQTVLLKGKVSAGKNKLFAETIDLYPGERIVYDKEGDSIAKGKVDVQLYTSWINGYLIFDNEPTTEVFKKLERYYNQRIISSGELSGNTFSGKLDLKDNIKDVLENISFASSVKVTEENGSFIIK